MRFDLVIGRSAKTLLRIGIGWQDGVPSTQDILDLQCRIVGKQGEVSQLLGWAQL